MALANGLRASDPSAYRNLTDAFHERLQAAYDVALLGLPDGISCGNLNAINTSIAVLEADPWVFRSGYLKARLLNRLKRTTLSIGHVERLSHVLLKIVDDRDRPEFRAYCRLAAVLPHACLRTALSQRITNVQLAEGVRRRARWMMAYIDGRGSNIGAVLPRRRLAKPQHM